MFTYYTILYKLPFLGSLSALQKRHSWNENSKYWTSNFITNSLPKNHYRHIKNICFGLSIQIYDISQIKCLDICLLTSTSTEQLISKLIPGMKLITIHLQESTQKHPSHKKWCIYSYRKASYANKSLVSTFFKAREPLKEHLESITQDVTQNQ